MEIKYAELYERNTSPSFWDEPQSDCNCGSFALNLTEWFVPYLDEDDVEDNDEAFRFSCAEREGRMLEMLNAGYTAEEVMEVAIDYDWEFILKTCPWLRPIKLEDAVESDRVIAYRLHLFDKKEVPDWTFFDIVEDGDFHFMVRIDGVWYEKNGQGDIHEVECVKDVREDWLYPEICGGIAYSGPIRFAKFREAQSKTGGIR